MNSRSNVGESMATLKRMFRIGLVLAVPAVTVVVATANHLHGF